MLITSLLTGTTVLADVVPVENRGYILVGDSRTVGMDSACDVAGHANIFVVAKVSQGYWWLKHDGWGEVERIKSEHNEFNAWTIVSNLGANDITNYDDYIEFYNGLEDDFVFVSVNPVGRCKTLSNEQIDKFNTKLRAAGFKFIDTNSALKEYGFSSPDGLHYSDSTYKVIFQYIAEGLGFVETGGVVSIGLISANCRKFINYCYRECLL